MEIYSLCVPAVKNLVFLDLAKSMPNFWMDTP